MLAPDLSGAWVAFNGNAGTPTHSPAPTYAGGCEDPRNLHLDKCFKMKYGAPMSSVRTFWINMNKIGQLSIISLSVMSVVFTVAFMIVRIRRRQRRASRKLLGIKKRTIAFKNVADDSNYLYLFYAYGIHDIRVFN